MRSELCNLELDPPLQEYRLINSKEWHGGEQCGLGCVKASGKPLEGRLKLNIDAALRNWATLALVFQLGTIWACPQLPG